MVLTPDLNQAERFLTLLAEDETVSFQTFIDQGENPALARILHGDLVTHAATLAELNQQGAGVFVMVNQGDGQGRKAHNVTAVRALFVDLDGSPLEPIESARLEPHIIVESSPQRFHAYWLVCDCSLNRFTPLQTALARKFKGDFKVKDLSRVMRLPGFWHQKQKPFLTRTVKMTPVLPYAVEKVITALGLQLSEAAAPPDSEPLTIKPPVDRLAILNGVEEGVRDSSIFRMACSLRAKDVHYKEAKILVLAAAANCRPPLPETQALKCLNSAWRYDQDQGENLTDMGNARRLVRQWGDDIRFVPEFKKWLVWNRNRWCTDEDGAVMRMAKQTAANIYGEAKNAAAAGEKDLAEEIAQHAHKSQSLQRLTAMIELAKSEPGIPLRQSQLDSDHWLLGVSNGVINLKTGALRAPRREDYISKQAHIEYDPRALCPTWESFLHRIMAGKENLIAFLQRAVGYSLTGDTSEQCLFFLHGSGANGKTTFLNVFKELLGDYAIQCPAETLMVKQHSGIPNDIARLRGARFVATSETEEGRRFAEAMIKQLTGGDVITARFLFAEYFEFTPNFKIWLAANHKPVIRGDDCAIWRRIRLIPFDVTIPPEERDKDLPAKLRAEYPGILAWAVRGCLEWQRQGLNPPPEVILATEVYKSEMDLIGEWLEECCLIAPHAFAKASALYQRYRQWVERNGGYPMSHTKFGLKMAERGFQKEKSGSVIYRGIGLLEGLDSWDSFHGSSHGNAFA